MSIWDDIAANEGSMPFYGFPVIPEISGKAEDMSLTLTFPEGYSPDGDQTEEVGEGIAKLYNGKVVSVITKGEKTQVIISIDPGCVAETLVEYYMDSGID